MWIRREEWEEEDLGSDTKRHSSKEESQPGPSDTSPLTCFWHSPTPTHTYRHTHTYISLLKIYASLRNLSSFKACYSLSAWWCVCVCVIQCRWLAIKFSCHWWLEDIYLRGFLIYAFTCRFIFMWVKVIRTSFFSILSTWKGSCVNLQTYIPHHFLSPSHKHRNEWRKARHTRFLLFLFIIALAKPTNKAKGEQKWTPSSARNPWDIIIMIIVLLRPAAHI